MFKLKIGEFTQITPENVKAVLAHGGVEDPLNLLNHRLVKEQLYSKITDFNAENLQVYYGRGKRFFHHELKMRLKPEGVKPLSQYHSQSLLHSMNILSEERLASLDIPADVSIVVPMPTNRWLHLPKPSVWCIERSGGKRRLALHPVDTVLDHNHALIVQTC